MAAVLKVSEKVNEAKRAHAALVAELPFQLPLEYCYVDPTEGVRVEINDGVEKLTFTEPFADLKVANLLASLDELIAYTNASTVRIAELNAYMRAERLFVEFKVDSVTLETCRERESMLVHAALGSDAVHAHFNHGNEALAKWSLFNDFAQKVQERKLLAASDAHEEKVKRMEKK